MEKRILVQIPRNQVGDFLDEEPLHELDRLGDVVWNPYDRPLTESELMAHIRDVHAVVTTWKSAPITETVFAKAGRLELIAHMAGSVKPIVTTMKVYEGGVKVVNSNYAIGVSVSESVLALILALGHHIIPVSEAMRNGVLWKSAEAGMESFELRGKTVGLIGLGMVAREVVKLLKPFDVRILVCDPFINADTARALTVELVSLRELLSFSDIISVHAPKVPQTYHMIGAEELSLIRDGAIFINTARGDIIDEQALIRELEKGRFVAGLDVYETEPLGLDSPLRRLPNVIARPHLAGVNPDSKKRIGKLMVEEIGRYFRDEPLRFEVKKEQLANMT